MPAPDLREAEFRSALHALMPQGPAWPREPGTLLDALLGALASRAAEHHGRVVTLADIESYPAATSELLADWEGAYGLPDACQQPAEPAPGTYPGPVTLPTDTNAGAGKGANTTRVGTILVEDGSTAPYYTNSATSFAYVSKTHPMLEDTTYRVTVRAQRIGGTGTTGRIISAAYGGPGGTTIRTNVPMSAVPLDGRMVELSVDFTNGAAGSYPIYFFADTGDVGKVAIWDARIEALPPVIPLPTAEERRQALLARIAERGGQSRAYFIGVAAALGYAVTIDEFRPARIGVAAIGDPIHDQDWAFTWRMNAPEETVTPARIGISTIGDPLQSWGNQILECTIRRIAPARTVVLFGYT